MLAAVSFDWVGALVALDRRWQRDRRETVDFGTGDLEARQLAQRQG